MGVHADVAWAAECVHAMVPVETKIEVVVVCASKRGKSPLCDVEVPKYWREER